MNTFLAFMLVAILLQSPPPVGEWPLLVLLSLIPASYFFKRGTTLVRLMGLLGLLIGLLVVTWEQQSMQTLAAVAIPQGAVAVTGVVADREDRQDSTLLLLTEATIAGHAVAGLLRLSSRKSKVFALPGDRVAVQAKFYPRRRWIVPGSFDLDSYFLGQGVSLQGRLLDEVVNGLADTGDWRWNRLRENISQQVGLVLPAARRGLAEAMLLGKRGWLERPQREGLQTAGIYHLVAISGLHMAVVAGWTIFVTRWLLVLVFPLSRRWDVRPLAAFIALFPLIGYALLAGWSVSVQRALLMTLVLLGSILLGRTRSTWRGLTLAAILLLAWQPSQLYNVGFQLSFLAVATILAVDGWLKEQKIEAKWLQYLIITLAVGTVLSPITAHYFHMVSWYGFFANLATVPWSSAVTVPLGFLALLSYPISLDVFNTLVGWMDLSLQPMVWVADWNHALPGGWWRVPGPPLLALVTGLVMLITMPDFDDKRWRTAVIAVAFGLTWWPRGVLEPGKVLFIALDVGQAQATLLRDDQGGWHVVDAGGMITPRYHVGEGLISPFLWQAGAKRLERIVISHPQQDHLAGAERLLENFTTRELWIGDFPEKEATSKAYQTLLATARARGTRIVAVAAGHEVTEHGLGLRVIHPPAASHFSNINNGSLTILARYGDHRILLPGDLEKESIRQLMKSGQDLRANLLMAPHHGAAGALVTGFAQRVRPDHFIISVGAGNPFRFPNPRAVGEWVRSGARIWRTDLDGTVLLASDGKKWKVLESPPRFF